MNRIRKTFEDFLARVAGRQFKPQRKFIEDALFGILEKRSVMLSEIGRALDEPTRLIHTEKRLSRNLGSDRFHDEAIEEDYLRIVAPFLRDEHYRRPVVAVDLTDIAKPRARAMPHLGRVHDGSKGVIADGYQIVNIEAVGEHGRRLPLASRLFSAAHPDFRSEYRIVDAAIALVRPHVPDDAVWVFDRGFEGRNYLSLFKERKITFVVRIAVPRHSEHSGHEQKQRNIYVGDERRRIAELVDSIPAPHTFRCRKFGPHAKQQWRIAVGWIPEIRLQGYSKGGNPVGPGDEVYSLVVARGVGSGLGLEPLVVITNFPVRSDEDAQNVIDAYMERWGVEEAHRFVKQAFDLENVRALTWQGLRRLVLLAMLAYGFLASLVHGSREEIEAIAVSFKAFGPVPIYLYYRLLEGVGKLICLVAGGAR